MEIQFQFFEGLGTIPKMKTGRFGSQPERSVFPVWVLTGFACYSARKSRSLHAGFRKCIYTCCACYSPFPMLASAISRMEIGGNRRRVCPKVKLTDAVNGGAAVHLDH